LDGSQVFLRIMTPTHNVTESQAAIYDCNL
jgi:hypothetical protein